LVTQVAKVPSAHLKLDVAETDLAAPVSCDHGIDVRQ